VVTPMIRCPECRAVSQFHEDSCGHCGFKVPFVSGFPAWSPVLEDAADGFKPEYFAGLAAREAEHFWFRGRNALIIWALRKYFPNFSSFLEVGCGTGFVLAGVSKAFTGVRLAGSELFPEGLEIASARVPAAAFVQMDARKIPYVDEFDVIGAFDVIEHIKEDMVVLENLYRAVRPGGGVLIAVPQHPWLWSAADDYGLHQRRYGVSELQRKLQRAGFKVIRSTSFVSLLLPAMSASRLLRRRPPAEYDPAEEFDISPMVNRLFEGVLGIERTMIAAGLNLPFGGSRLVVAKKAA
jgi:SAM-dependent methyltransferase